MSWYVIFGVLGVGLFALIWVEHLTLSRAVFRPHVPPRRRERYPSITVIRPIRGLDPGCRDNTLALLEQVYPGEVQTLFVFDHVGDPALPTVSELTRTHPNGRNAQVLIAGPPPKHRTGKLNAMMVGLEHARGQLVAFNDSDTRPTPFLLRLLVDELLDHPKAGCTFAPVVTHREPRTMGEAAYTLLVNAWYGPAVTRASLPRGELPFIMGELMVFKREALDAIGGLQCADGQLVDDMYLGACVARAGFKNVMVRWPLHIVTEGLSVLEFMKLFRRWMACSQSGLPARFVRANWWRGTQAALASALTVAALAMGKPWAAAFPAAALACFVGSQLALHVKFSGQLVKPRHVWIAAVLPWVGALVAASTKLDPQVDWRGRSYSLDGGAALANKGPSERTAS